MANILIVDDSSVMRKNLTSILTKAGHEIIGHASNGKQAISMYFEKKPDLVTMDISMPVMRGVEAVERIIQKDPEARIIVISALNQKQMVFQALNNGAKHYIIKPIDTDKVLSIVNEVLEESYSDSSEDVNSTQLFNENTKSGFHINNKEGKFYVTFNEHYDFKDQTALNTAIQGLMFIKPLHVIFDFNNDIHLQEELLGPIIKLGSKIQEIGGTLEIKATSEELRTRFSKEKYR